MCIHVEDSNPFMDPIMISSTNDPEFTVYEQSRVVCACSKWHLSTDIFPCAGGDIEPDEILVEAGPAG